MNQHEERIFDYLRKCNRNESYLNEISRKLQIDKTDARNALKSMTSGSILSKRIDGKKIIYQINPNYRDHLLELLDSYESRIGQYKQEIDKSIIYLKNKKLFSRDLKFKNNVIKENVEAIIRFSKAIMDIITQIRHIEIFSRLDDSHIKKTIHIQKTAFDTVKNVLNRFRNDHAVEQQSLSIYLEFQIPLLYVVM